METQKSHFNWLSLILGILLIFGSIVSLQDPTGNLVSITIFIGLLGIIKGIFILIFHSKMKKAFGKSVTSLVFVGVFDIILGFILLTNITYGIIALPFLFAIWFIVDSVTALFSLDIAKEVSTAYYWFSLIINVIGIFLGVMLFFDPITSALTLSFIVGFYLMMIGMSLVVHAFTDNN